MDLAIADFHVDEEIVAERTAEQMAGLGFGGLARRQQTEANLFGNHRMIARNLQGGAVANEVTAGIAHVRHDDTIVTERARHDGGRHSGSTRAGGLAKLIDAGIGGLNEARHQDRVCFTLRGGAKSGDQRFHGRLGSDLAQFLATDAVGHSEQPTMCASVDLRRRRQMAEVILIVAANAADIGQFGEFKIQHGSGGRTKPCGRCKHNASLPGLKQSAQAKGLLYNVV